MPASTGRGTAPGASPAIATGAPNHGTPSNPGATHDATPPSVVLLRQIAKLPPFTDTGIHAGTQSRAILKHLNNILRFYRAAMQPLQKVGEPSDVLYAEQTRMEATQIAQLAFQSASNEAALLVKADPAGMTAANSIDTTSGTSTQTQVQHLAALLTGVEARIASLQARSAALDTELTHANSATRARLEQQREQIDGDLELEQATANALKRIRSFSDAQSKTGLAGDIERLQRSVPALTVATTAKPIPPSIESLSNIHQAGVSTQAEMLFQLLSARRNIENQIALADRLKAQATALRLPFIKILHSTLERGQQLAQAAPAPAANSPKKHQTSSSGHVPSSVTAVAPLAATREQFDQLTNTFEVLSDSMLPLTQEIVLLRTERNTLAAWDAAVDAEYNAILRSLLLRLTFIAITLLVLFALGLLWNRATIRYVQDLRRRRQLLLVRRFVVGFLSILVIVFGFVTQFSSLAMFAGFGAAGIAVGLQSILLSVAAYFFIIGRYGIKVGDRITVAGVTGDVVEVGLVRFYMMEMVGTGTTLHATGRVAVFANSVLFQSGTPLYKQMPGTEYAWHELIAKLTPTADAEAVRKALLDVITNVYQTYQAIIESQHNQVMTWAGTAIEMPKITSRLEMPDTGLQIAVLFPVQIQCAAETDHKIASALLEASSEEGPLHSGLSATPTIRSSIKA